MALAVAIFALVVVGALVAGAFFAGNLEQATGRNSVYAAEAADAAEAGAATVLADWDQFNLNTIASGETVPLALPQSLGARVTVTPTVTRLNDDLFLVRTFAKRTTPGGSTLAQRSVATVARLSYVTATAKAAVTVTKPIKFNGNSFNVIGNDSMPAGWAGETGCPASGNLAGVRSATTTGAASSDNDNLFGNPPQVANDPTVTTDFFNMFGDVTFADLVKNADIVLPNTTPYNGAAPSLTAGSPQRCNTADQLNWGEPRRSGADSSRSASTTSRSSTAAARSSSSRPAAVGRASCWSRATSRSRAGSSGPGSSSSRGGIRINGNGNKITGAVLAGRRDRRQNSISGNTTLQYSSCALSKAIKGSAFAEPLG